MLERPLPEPPARGHRALLLTLVLGLTPALGCGPSGAPPRAVILLVGDGLGFSQLTLARYAAGGRERRLRLESMPVTGIVSTWSASNFVTDSGAASTAFSSGIKTDNRYIGLDPSGARVTTIGERAAAAGWRVGYVTSTRITHATPACFYGHHDDRYDEETIAAQLLDANVDLALGGGRSFFVPFSDGGARRDDRDLLARARADGWTVLERGDVLQWNGEGRLLGLFANSHLAYDLDDRAFPAERRDPSLASLAELALDGLSRGDRPFFLMLEGGRIDHAAHDFDAAGIVAETMRFDEAVAVVLDWAERHPGTLVLLTADHATGGLAINDSARWDDLEKRTASVASLTAAIRYAGAGVGELRARTGYDDWTDDAVAAIRAAPDSYSANRVLGRLLAARDGFTWSTGVTDDDTHGHTGEDVPLYASGPGAERFAGVLDNTEIPRRLVSLLGWNGVAPQP
ncbi:MAG: alkaline phosphatase [Thermoanaerobaculia bacterium]